MDAETIINYSIGIGGIVIGIIVSYYFYKKSIRAKEPVFSLRSNNLISGSVSTLENLNISYKDYKVENLTVSKLLFFNRGVEPITRKDTETRSPLRISSETCKILDCSVIQVNKVSNNFQAYYEPASKNILIDFDYLNQNQGAVIQLIHTGLSSGDIEISGDIVGVEKLREVSPETLKVKTKFNIRDWDRSPLVFIVSSVGSLIVAIQVIDLINTINPKPAAADSNNFLIIGFIIMLVLFLNIILASSSGLLKYKTLIPEGLEKILE